MSYRVTIEKARHPLVRVPGPSALETFFIYVATPAFDYFFNTQM